MNGFVGIRRTLGLLSLLLGLVLLVGTGALMGLFAAGGGVPREGPLATAAIFQAVGIGGLGLAVGLTALLLGWRLLAGRPSGPFRARYFWVLLALFPMLLVGGMAAALWDEAPLPLLGVVHLATLLALPALVLGALGRLVGRHSVSWHDVLGGFLGGSTLGAGAAILLEMGVIAFLGVLLFAAGLIPRDWLSASFSSSPFQTPEEGMILLGSIPPAVVLAGVVFLSFLAPLVEEMTKTLAVGVASLWLRPVPLRAFFLGAACGAGFALAENFLNSGFFGFLWGGGVLARLAATVMHVATGALMGWGWGQWGTERKYARLPLAFLGAVGLHGLWNGGAALSLGMLYLALRADPAGLTAVLAAFLILFAVAFQGLLSVGVALALFLSARSLARNQEESARLRVPPR